MRLGVVPYAVGATCGRRRLTRLLEQSGFDVPFAGTIMHAPRVLLVPWCRHLARRGATRPGAWLERWLLPFRGARPAADPRDHRPLRRRRARRRP